MHNVPPGLAELRRREPLVRAGPLLRIAETKQLLHIADYTEYVASHPADSDAALFAKLTGVRTALEVPMLKNDWVVGAIVIYRTEVRSFDDREIVLIKDFAAQAVIAIENARLLNELRQSLEQQTATAEVLKVVSTSPGELSPVFSALLEKAIRICGAKFGNLWLREDDVFCIGATYGAPATYVEFLEREQVFRPDRRLGLGQIIQTKETFQIADIAAEPSHTDRMRRATIELAGARTLIGVPMLKDGEVIGAIGIYRQEVRPFTDRQIDVVKNFAAQAVIAIENARLLKELRQRTTDLTEALEQQTATSDVLRVISGSPGELKPVFDAMLESATRICDATFGSMLLRDGDAYRRVALHNAPQKFSEYSYKTPILRPGMAPGVDRVIHTRQAVHIPDLEAENPNEPIVKFGGARTILAVPMLKEEEVIGVIGIYRQEVRLFSDKQIKLLQNFAAQAVIAIENARLLNELRQSLEQQTATAEVLGVISRSRFELQPVLQSVVDTATLLCRAKLSGMWRLEGGRYRLAAASGRLDPAYRETQQQASISPGLGTLVGRAAMKREVVQIDDAWNDPLYEEKENAKLGGVRSMIGVPLMREGEPIGVFGLARTQVEPFVEREIELVRTFADQAVIAIENARLLNELRERTDQLQSQSQELAKLNQQLEQRVADQVGEIERMGRLRRFLPPQVADLIVASGTEKQLESHRREITALFCDLRGFTGFTETADAEDVMALLRDYHATVGEKIIKYSGTLERYAGDGVMVVFNDPVPVENPALQAVLMALEMRDAIGALTETWRRLGHEIGFGIGIAHGFATLGTIGFEGRFDYAAIGTVSNVASRLCDEAKPGQILISPRVLMKVENAVEVEPVGEFDLKGIRRPLAAYNVVAASPSKV